MCTYDVCGRTQAVRQSGSQALLTRTERVAPIVNIAVSIWKLVVSV